jgi:hypothetical protein
MDRSTECQIHSLDKVHLPLGRLEIAWQLRNRLRRAVKRRVAYVGNIVRRIVRSEPAGEAAARATEIAKANPLARGDRVRVKSREEIQRTLDDWNELRGCGFMEEMWKYCGTEQVVFKRIENFLDERDYRVKKVRNIVILDGLLCEGTVDFGPCDRSCFFFWRDEWLEKL